MWYQVLIPTRVLLIPVLIMTTTKCQAPRNNSDVIVTYSNHAEADIPNKILVPETSSSPKTVATVPSTSDEYLYATETATLKLKPVTESIEVADEPVQDDVLFLPNDREHERNEEYLQNEAMSFGNIMGYKNIGDVMKKPIATTEQGKEDIIFVAGKNHEIEDKSEKERPSNKGTYVDAPYGEEPTVKPKPLKLNCRNLDCDNTIQSVCGGKVENMKWRYRLFLNECYFRKVNCNFRNSENRFKEVGLQYCRHVGVHQSERPDVKPPDKFDIKPVQVDNTRRSESSRRSMSMDIDGRYCSHPCPASCPEDYEPECAVSMGGEYKMFLNHCSLDLNSCSFGLVWRKRPMAECVGGKKADMRQNRGFIAWMQRVGIVDNKGRLVLS